MPSGEREQLEARYRRRTALRQLDDAQLAVALAESLLEQGDPLLRELDARSPAWRSKARKSELSARARPPTGGR